MNGAIIVGRTIGTGLVLIAAILLLLAEQYTKRVEFNEFDFIFPLATFAQIFGPPVLLIGAAGAAIEATAAGFGRSTESRPAAVASAAVLWIVVGVQVFLIRRFWYS